MTGSTRRDVRIMIYRARVARILLAAEKGVLSQPNCIARDVDNLVGTFYE